MHQNTTLLRTLVLYAVATVGILWFYEYVSHDNRVVPWYRHSSTAFFCLVVPGVLYHRSDKCPNPASSLGSMDHFDALNYQGRCFTWEKPLLLLYRKSCI